MHASVIKPAINEGSITIGRYELAFVCIATFTFDIHVTLHICEFVANKNMDRK